MSVVSKSELTAKLRSSSVWAKAWNVEAGSDGSIKFSHVREAGDSSAEICVSYRPRPSDAATVVFVFTEEQEDSPAWNEGLHSMLMTSSNFLNWLADSFGELAHYHQNKRRMDDSFEIQWGTRPLEVLQDTAGRFGLGYTPRKRRCQ